MSNTKDIRWKQRFDNYEKAYLLLEKACLIENPSETERAGIIQFFEMAFELSWKLLKDYLEDEGYIIKTPRQAIKQALQANIIINNYQWIDALDDRNLTVHTYHEETAIEVEDKIHESYLLMLKELYDDFKLKVEQE